MPILFVALGLLLFSNLYGIISKVLKFKKNNTSVVIYGVIGLVVAACFVYMHSNEFHLTQRLLLAIVLVGYVVRLGVQYTRRGKAL
jgi:steroid 5-alpha reductase family enzyme